MSEYLDELLYDTKIVSQALLFALLRKKSRVDELMQGSGGENYSKMLRKHQFREQ